MDINARYSIAKHLFIVVFLSSGLYAIYSEGGIKTDIVFDLMLFICTVLAVFNLGWFCTWNISNKGIVQKFINIITVKQIKLNEIDSISMHDSVNSSQRLKINKIYPPETLDKKVGIRPVSINIPSNVIRFRECVDCLMKYPTTYIIDRSVMEYLNKVDGNNT